MTRTFNPMALLRSADRKRLLLAEDRFLLGLVMELNRSSRYHNRLDALQLASLIIQHRQRRRDRS